jgi:hypothetical protein
MRCLPIAVFLGAIAVRVLFGQADLQGVWVSNSATPLQRPAALNGRTTLSDAEVAEFQRRADRLVGDPDNDYVVGDAFFLSALNDVKHYAAPGVTDHTWENIPRYFEKRTSLITDPPDGKIPALTDAARARNAAARRPEPRGPEDLNPIERCISWGIPRVGGNTGAGPYSYYQIFQTPDYVAFYHEMVHETRIIPLGGPLGGRAHLAPSIHLWDGDSVGYWEGGTLVVDTRNLVGGFMGSGANLHLIEKFTRVSQAKLEYEITIDDPDTWTKPWTVMIPLSHSDDKIYEVACHEGNFTVMKGMLGGGQ